MDVTKTRNVPMFQVPATKFGSRPKQAAHNFRRVVVIEGDVWYTAVLGRAPTGFATLLMKL